VSGRGSGGGFGSPPSGQGFLGTGLHFGPSVTPPTIRYLLIALLVAFVLQSVLQIAAPGSVHGPPGVVKYLGLTASRFWSGMLWQPLTAIFLHSELRHLLGNMFILWMFGASLVQVYGGRRVMRYFLVGGAAAGALKMLLAGVAHLVGFGEQYAAWDIPSIGASGAVYVLFTLFCLSQPRTTISLILVPLYAEAIWFLRIAILLELLGSFGPVDNTIHLCGIFVGWVIARGPRQVLELPERVSEWLAARRDRARRSHLRVVKPEHEGPTYH
jgi:membrane associated rhomboid family serine protease